MDYILILRTIEACAVVLGVALALGQWRLATRQRAEELRWRRSQAAWEVLDRVFTDTAIMPGLALLDGLEVRVPRPLGEVRLMPEDLRLLRQTEDVAANDEERERLAIVRESFDSILYGYSRIRASIESGHVLRQDVANPTRHYAQALVARADILSGYAQRAGYPGLWAFIEDWAR